MPAKKGTEELPSFLKPRPTSPPTGPPTTVALASPWASLLTGPRAFDLLGECHQQSRGPQQIQFTPDGADPPLPEWSPANSRTTTLTLHVNLRPPKSGRKPSPPPHPPTPAWLDRISFLPTLWLLESATPFPLAAEGQGKYSPEKEQ